MYSLPRTVHHSLHFLLKCVLAANTGANTVAPWFTCDRRIAQSNAKEKRVQPNTHRLPRAAVKSHWCQKGDRRERDTESKLKPWRQHLSYTLIIAVTSQGTQGCLHCSCAVKRHRLLSDEDILQVNTQENANDSGYDDAGERINKLWQRRKGGEGEVTFCPACPFQMDRKNMAVTSRESLTLITWKDMSHMCKAQCDINITVMET